METLENIIVLVEKSQILNEATFSGVDLDAILDIRDSDPFDSDWINANKELETSWLDHNPNSEEVESLRELVFFKVSKLTNHHEISSYVSDDFELIGKCIALGHENEFIQRIHDTYISGKLPQ